MQIVDRAYILYATKYSETSLITHLLTEHYGHISCISKGVRTTGRQARANMLEVGNLIEIELNSNPLKNLQFLQNFKLLDTIGQGKFSPVRQTIVLYMMEYLYKILKEPEIQTDLFQLTEKYYLFIRTHAKEEISNVPLSFTIDVMTSLGFSVEPWLASHQIDLESVKLNSHFQKNKSELLLSLIEYIDAYCLPLHQFRSLAILREIVHI